MGRALFQRPVRMPRFPTASMGSPNLGYTPVEGPALATNEDDANLILLNEPQSHDIVVESYT